MTVEGRELRSLFREDGPSYWWWCETSMWEGWGDRVVFPGAVQVAWTVEAIRRLLADGPSLLRIAGNPRAALLRLAIEVAKTENVRGGLRTRAP